MRISQKLPKYGRIETHQAQALAPRVGQKGRGATTNNVGRFERIEEEIFDDGWGTIEETAPRLETVLHKEIARSIITFNQSPDVPFDRSINPYRGCEHGCVFCFARPSHAYIGHSAGLDFESQLYFKVNAVERLRKELAAKSYTPRPITLGINTDAYQPIEKRMRLTRGLLEVLAEYNHPVSFLTKSALILRDLDLLVPMFEKNLVSVALTITTLDKALARNMEPRAAAPHRRLETIRRLTDAGIQVRVMMAPIIPALNEAEIEPLLEACRDAGATHAGYVLLRLPYELKDIFQEWLATYYPDRAARVINTLRTMRGGKDYDAEWRKRGTGDGVHARLLVSRFSKACARLGLNTSHRDPLRTDLFSKPSRDTRQMSFDV